MAAVLKDCMGTIATATVGWGILLSSSVLATPASPAVAEANPYAAVVQRNIFRLREPVTAPLPLLEAPAARDTGELVLTGIVDFRKAKWALLTLTERGMPLRRYTLSVGQKEDNLQVLAIDAATATVRVLHGAAEVVLTFDTHVPPNQKKFEELGRKNVQQAKPFVDEHTRAHAVREQREAERRELERAAAAAELAARKTSNQQ